MSRNPSFSAFLAIFFLVAPLYAECTKKNDHRDGGSGIEVTDFVVNGTKTLSSSDLARITNKLMGSCFNEDAEELEERVRALFQDQGYFSVEVKELRMEPGDPLVIPKPVTLEADVTEGPRYKVAEINFTGNRAFNTSQLRNAFSLRRGDLFERGKIAVGLEGVRKLYSPLGFVDMYMIPEVLPSSDATLSLAVNVHEGPQYRMGTLEVFAKKELADKLRAGWQLTQGSVFDFTYLDQFIEANHPLLPAGFTRENLEVVLDCPHALANLRLLVDWMDAAAQTRPQDVECESSDKDRQ